MWEEDLKASSVELVYGSTLRLRGKFYAPSPVECTNITDFASQLRVHITKLWPVPASRHSAPSTFIFKDLVTASHVFLQQGTLQAPYVGPYRVIHKSGKTYSIKVHGAVMTVSIHRLKPVYVLHVSNTKSTSPPATPFSITTCSGRNILFLDYLAVQRSWRGV